MNQTDSRGLVRKDLLTGWANRAASTLSLHGTLALVVMLTCYAGLCLWHASRKPFWFDELFTLYISRLPTVRELFQVLPADGNPPLNYLLTRIPLSLLGQTPIALRIVPLAGVLVATVCVYGFVRFRCDALFALVGAAALMGSAVGEYAYEARPYGLLLGCTAFTLLCWQRAAARDHHRVLSLCGVAVGLAGAICTHHYGLLYAGFPLFAGEAIRLTRTRRVDVPMIVAVVCGLSMLAFTFPLMQQTRAILTDFIQRSTTFWSKPMVHQIPYVMLTFPLAMFVAFASVFCATQWSMRLSDRVRTLSSRLRVALLSMFLVAVATMFAARAFPSNERVAFLGSTLTSAIVIFLAFAAVAFQRPIPAAVVLIAIYADYKIFYRSYGEHVFYGGLSALVLACLAVLVIVVVTRRWRWASRIPDYEVIAAASCALLMAIVWVLAKLSTQYFTPRYMVGSAIGMAMLCGLSTSLLGRRRNLFAITMLASTLVFSVLWREVDNGKRHDPNHGPYIDPPLNASVQGGPIVVPDSFTFLALTWYAPENLRSRVTYLTDVPYAMHEPDVVPDLTLVANRSIVPGRIEDYSKFLSQNRRFYLYCIEDPSNDWLVHHQWLEGRLLAEGAQLTPVARNGFRILYRVDYP